MITVRKLRSLPPKTMLRKILTLMEEWEQGLATGREGDRDYLRKVLNLLQERDDLLTLPQLRAAAGLVELLALPGAPDSTDPQRLLRLLHHLRYGIMGTLGAAPADWDFFDADTGTLTREGEKVLPIRLYLDDVRSPYNVGSIFRTAEAFGVEGITISPYTASPAHRRALRTSMGCTEILPWESAPLEKIAPPQAVFALELGGTEINRFDFPSAGLAVIGSEELGISPEAREIARRSAGIVSIPLRGAKASLNVAAATGILLHAWVTALTRG